MEIILTTKSLLVKPVVNTVNPYIKEEVVRRRISLPNASRRLSVAVDYAWGTGNPQVYGSFVALSRVPDALPFKVGYGVDTQAVASAASKREVHCCTLRHARSKGMRSGVAVSAQ